jgi:PBP1b-binding outer membrane lipoprotein LpoB
MEKKSFIDKHPNVTSIVSAIVWFVVIALMAFFTSCKGTQNYVEIVKTDTLHVYHTDTLKVVHNDTVYSVITQTVHDSIVRETIVKEVVNELGEIIHTEKETNNEHWHNSDTNQQLIQHKVDSILQAKMDSINQSQYVEKPVIVEVEKSAPWYSKVWNWIVSKFAWVGLGVLIIALLYYLIPKLWKW